jgi:hypothetical protein
MARRRFFKRSKSEADSAESARSETSPAQPRRRRREQSPWYNRLALSLLLLTLVVFVCYLLIFMIPTLPLNLFPPMQAATFA